MTVFFYDYLYVVDTFVTLEDVYWSLNSLKTYNIFVYLSLIKYSINGFEDGGL